MKKKLLTTLVLASVLLLSSCGGEKEVPMTEAQQADKYGMSVSEFKEQKDAAARMNMTIEDHLKMSDNWETMDHSNMDMWDDSSMIEDDSEMSGMDHTMSDGSKMSNDEAMTWDSTHTMDDGTEMKDDEMHMEMMHDGEEIDDHSSEEHGSH